MKLSKPMLLYVGAGVILVGGIAACLNQLSANGSEESKLNQLKLQVKNEAEVRALLDDSEKNLLAAQQKLQHLEQGLPEKAYVPSMLEELERTGRQNGINVYGVKPAASKEDPKDKKKKKAKSYNELEIEVSGEGSFSAMQRLLASLDSFPKIMMVESITLEPKETNQSAIQGSPRLKINVNMRTYLFPTDPSTQESTDKEKSAALEDSNGNG